jgi:epsin
MDRMFRYLGVSSTGMSYKSSAASFGNGSYSSGSRTGGGSRGTASFRDSYTGTERSKSSKDTVSSYGSTRHRSKETTKRTSRSKSEKEGPKSLSNPHAASGVAGSEKAKNEDEGDDFNPRGSSTSGQYFLTSSLTIGLIVRLPCFFCLCSHCYTLCLTCYALSLL